MFSRCDSSELTEARSPKTGDAAEKAEGDSLGDDCIPVYLNSCLTYRREDVPTSCPDAFGCTVDKQKPELVIEDSWTFVV